MNERPANPPIRSLTHTQQLFANAYPLPYFQGKYERPIKSFNALSALFMIYEHSRLNTLYQSAAWLWEQRIPRAGITLLDGDHGCAKTLLAHSIAAAITRGTPLPDGTPTQQGGVILVTPHDAPRIQASLLTTLGADLSRIRVLSFICDPALAPTPDLSDYRCFSLPEDFPLLFQTAKHINARLIIFDPFITVLSRHQRWGEMHLSHLLSEFNQSLIEHNIACLLTRNCPAKGGEARPCPIERSNSFVNTAVSHHLLARHPIQRDLLLLCHVSGPYSFLKPSLAFKIQPHPTYPDFPLIKTSGFHQLSAHDFLENRPNALIHRILMEHFQEIIANSTAPVHVSTFYKLYSTTYLAEQIQRALKELLSTGQITSPARGFYAQAPGRHASTPGHTIQPSKSQQKGPENGNSTFDAKWN